MRCLTKAHAASWVGRRLDQCLTRLAAYGFSGSVLVANGDGILLHKGYGFADAQRKVPNSTQTVYDVASLARQLTAAAILELETQKKLKTADTWAIRSVGTKGAALDAPGSAARKWLDAAGDSRRHGDKGKRRPGGRERIRVAGVSIAPAGHAATAGVV